MSSRIESQKCEKSRNAELKPNSTPAASENQNNHHILWPDPGNVKIWGRFGIVTGQNALGATEYLHSFEDG
jgi:hypothetical protein